LLAQEQLTEEEVLAGLPVETLQELGFAIDEDGTVTSEKDMPSMASRRQQIATTMWDAYAHKTGQPVNQPGVPDQRPGKRGRRQKAT
jgi:hypothetical protein